MSLLTKKEIVALFFKDEEDEPGSEEVSFFVEEILAFQEEGHVAGLARVALPEDETDRYFEFGLEAERIASSAGFDDGEEARLVTLYTDAHAFGVEERAGRDIHAPAPGNPKPGRSRGRPEKVAKTVTPARPTRAPRPRPRA